MDGQRAESSSFIAAVRHHSTYSRLRNLGVYLRSVFADVELPGRSMLEVGGGAGVMSLYAAARGAGPVVCLEPEAAGSESGISEVFESLGRATGLQDIVQFIPKSLEEYGDTSRRFNLILLHNSINHLDEAACTALPARRAVRTYKAIFVRLAELMEPGGNLVLADCSNRNFFGDLNLTNPVARSIEWEKHQGPEIWADLARAAGFRNPRLRWTPYDPLGPLGEIFANRIGAYFFRSHFVLTLERQREG